MKGGFARVYHIHTHRMGLFDFCGTKDFIVVQTDRSSYYAGEQVTGTVTLCLFKPLQLETIQLEVNGIEKCKHDFYFDSRVCLAHKLVLHSRRETFESGNYVFPFEFYLPSDIPNTLYFKRGDSMGEISYKVQAEVILPDPSPLDLFARDLKHEQEFFVMEPLTESMTSTQDFVEKDVNVLCCINKGRVSMSARADRNASSPGEIIPMCVTVDSTHSQSDFKELTFYIFRFLRLNVKNQTYYHFDIVTTMSSPMIPKGTTTERSVNLRIPSKEVYSVTGSLLTCEYFLVADLTMPWSIFTLRIKLPLRVYAGTQDEEAMTVQYPSNGSPITMQPVILEKE